MAKKVLKNRTQITSTLKNELNDKLKQLSVDTDVPISKLLDQAVELLLTKRGATRDTNKRNRDADMLVIDINMDEE